MILVDCGQLWPVVRAEQDAVRYMGDPGGPTSDERRSAYHQTRVQGDITE